MKRNIHILHLEDDPTDAEIVRLKLEEAGIDFAVDRVDSREDYLASLARREYDLILCDYTIPSFDGLSALSIAREKYPDIPFIFISGTIGEDRAIESFKRGATDYVLKRNIARLATAVERALREAEGRRERRLAQREREITVEFLRLVNESADTRALVRAVATFFQRQSGCEAVGIRLREGEDYPYYEVRGFPREFILAENSLCAKNSANCPVRDNRGDAVLECMCGNIICGRFDPEKPFFTQRGSFWTNSTTELLHVTTEADRQGRTRNRCNREGYESVALLPLRMGEQRLGLLQLNDRGKGAFTPEEIGLWERLADQLSIALAKCRGEERLKESEGKFRVLAEQSLVGSYVIQGGLFKYVNPRFAGMFGRSPEEIVDRMGLRDLIVPDDHHILDAASASWEAEGPYCSYEARGLKKTGELIYAEIFGSRAMYEGKPSTIGIVLDVTEKKKLERQLLQAQKMEAVGQLTGGIAHDFNNILSAIIGYGSLLKMKLSGRDPLRPFVDHILAASDRAANLTRSLLTFSRNQVAKAEVVDLNENIRRVERLLSRIIGEDVYLRTDLHPKPLPVIADSGQIEQVLMNLATNARDAMPQGGTLSIMTGLADAGAVEQLRPEGKGRPYAFITVSDTGVGMDEKTREKIFEPFFTTKDLGRGTGLGLSMAYGIIRKHKGYIHCYSEPGTGTTFKIYLPLLARAGETAAAPEGPALQEEPRQGKETILVVEDDASLRKLTVLILNETGYKVIEAVDGEDAVRKMEEHKDEIRLVLCDVIMPKKCGGEAEKEFRRIAPGVRTVFMSGYPIDMIKQKNLLDEGAVCILKPLSPTVLLKAVREELDRR